MTVVNPAGVRKVGGYSHALVRTGTPVFLTGQVAWDVDGAVVGAGDIDTQLERVWANVVAVLADLGAGLEDVVKLTTYATDPRHMAAIGAAKQRRFDPDRMPASTFLVVAALAHPDLLVEIDVVAVLPEGGAG